MKHFTLGEGERERVWYIVLFQDTQEYIVSQLKHILVGIFKDVIFDY